MRRTLRRRTDKRIALRKYIDRQIAIQVKKIRMLDRRFVDLDPSTIRLAIKGLCQTLVATLRRLVVLNPVFGRALAAAISMTAFWDAVNGVKDIGASAKNTFEKLLMKLRGETSEAKRYKGGAIVARCLRGIARLGISFFKFWSALKINRLSYVPYD